MLTEVCLAIIGGFTSGSGANLLAWSEFRARATGREWGPRAQFGFFAGCFVMNLTGIGLFALSTTMGSSVAVIMPMQTGANLLSNMFWQALLGMKFYTKNMRVGTIVLVCAVAELGELGPSPPSDDVLKYIRTPTAISWVSFLGLAIVASTLAWWRNRGAPRNSMPKLLSIVSIVSLTTVLGGNISKCFGHVDGLAAAALYCLYILDGVICMTFTLKGNAETDVSLYVPAQLASQLVINMFTGYAIWQDGRHVQHPVAYTMVYAICVLAVYIMTPELDFVKERMMSRAAQARQLSQGTASSRVGHGLLNLRARWENSNSGVEGGLTDPTQRETCRRAVIEVLDSASEIGAVDQTELTLLVVRLLEAGKGCGPNHEIVEWLETDVGYYRQYLRADPEFGVQLRATLSDTDRAGSPSDSGSLAERLLDPPLVSGQF